MPERRQPVKRPRKKDTATGLLADNLWQGPPVNRGGQRSEKEVLSMTTTKVKRRKQENERRKIKPLSANGGTLKMKAATPQTTEVRRSKCLTTIARLVTAPQCGDRIEAGRRWITLAELSPPTTGCFRHGHQGKTRPTTHLLTTSNWKLAGATHPPRAHFRITTQ